MSCCGNRRTAATVFPMTVHSASQTANEHTVRVRYAYGEEVAVRGRITGRLYYFTGAGSTSVALSDARVLIASGQFVAAK